MLLKREINAQEEEKKKETMKIIFRNDNETISWFIKSCTTGTMETGESGEKACKK